MLYVSTRSKNDTYTSHRALTEDRAPDGGMFVPFRMPYFEKDQLTEMLESGFCETVAVLLNVFFTAGLTAWDVECCIGKNPAKLYGVGHRAMLCGFWHNPKGCYGYMEYMLYHKLRNAEDPIEASDWAKIAIRISLLFGTYCLLRKEGVQCFDISVNVADFSVPMAVLYAKKMGLPVGKMICACNEDNVFWEFIHRGILNTAQATVNFATAKLDVSLPQDLERLILDAFGFEEVQAYLTAVQKKTPYRLPEASSSSLNGEIFVYVVGKDRVEPLVGSVYRSNGIILDPYTSVCYGSLQDHRAKFGEGINTLLLWDDSPIVYCKTVSTATGLTRAQIEEQINRI